jgi:NADPH-dependent curcumin reductase CurA
MTQNSTNNRKITLHSRPVGAPVSDNFCLVESAIPVPTEGQVLLRNLFLSLESYAAPVEIGAVMLGATVSQVEASHHPDFKAGELVLAYAGWQDFAVSDGVGLIKLAGMDHPSLALGALGMPGFTAYMGLLDIGQPKAGETVVVAAASGAVGSMVGQIAKLKGCRVVGIAGGADKCRSVVEELGFDACIDHRSPDLKKLLDQACPNGIDV